MIFLLPLGLLLLGFFIFGIVQSIGKAYRDKRDAEIEKLKEIRKTMRRKYGLLDAQSNEIILLLNPELLKCEERIENGNGGELFVGFIAIIVIGGGLIALGIFGGNWLPFALVGVPLGIYLLSHLKIFHNLLQWVMVLGVILFFVLVWIIGRSMWPHSALPW